MKYRVQVGYYEGKHSNDKAQREYLIDADNEDDASYAAMLKAKAEANFATDIECKPIAIWE